jgi:glutamate/tyrosine decarboxylase-like PLP-dependent enzyme
LYPFFNSDDSMDTWVTQDLRKEAETLVTELANSLQAAIAGADDRLPTPPDPDKALTILTEPLPETGQGSKKTLEKLLELQASSGTNTQGPRCYHFVVGGNTPAAHGADLIAAAFDVITYTWVMSPVGVRMELQALTWLKELLGLPASMAGVIVTGATMANFVGLAAARQWWGEQHGFDVSKDGLAGKPQMPVLTSGFVHAATKKVLATQGIGRDNIQQFTSDNTGTIDLVAFENALEALQGVHVDGAFGLFAAVSPRTAHLVKGVERADSVTVDGHKWLNVPYDSGYSFVRDYGLMARAFRYSADYLPSEDDAFPTPGAIGPESSRRGRSFAVWASLKAYGREGHRRIVEHCLDIAQHFAAQVEQRPDFELMAKVRLNIVPFRYNPGSLDDLELDELNRLLGQKVLVDGRFMVGTSKLGARTIFRPAFSNWRTRTGDVEALLDVIEELALESK